MTAREIILKAFGNSEEGRKYRILSYGLIDKYVAYELRKQERGDEKFIYQLVVVSYNPRTGQTLREEDLSNEFLSQEDVQQWLDELKEDIHEARKYHKAC